ncbi:MAG: hypothetical protein A2583_05525 [Bdellovibrionales bacterium RIFOXYD1_FULL_53_11]|nr:MAG: hypothetical protein A2583_05525 [Bdellovibrionales bacterium RIFOXYD1_FULL_53_11]
MDSVVVGSGPAGVMCAMALLDAGAGVLMLDVGEDLDSDKKDLVSRLARQNPVDWSREDYAAIMPPASSRINGGPPLKTLFGSAFAYSRSGMITVSQAATNCTMSHAIGGLSRVWGAAVLPWEVLGWPRGCGDLKKFYDIVGREIGVGAVRDDLEKIHPLPHPLLQSLPASVQSGYILSRMTRSAGTLDRRKMYFGRARLAVDTRAVSCKEEGICLGGCPYLLPYDATKTLQKLFKYKNFKYLPGHKVVSFRESGDRVEVVAETVPDSSPVSFNASRLFLASGVLSTASIVAGAMAQNRAVFDLKYNPYFLLPAVLFRNFNVSGNKPGHSLAQLFIEIMDDHVSKNQIHLQVYTYNPLMKDRIGGLCRNSTFLKSVLERHLLGRLVAIQGYLSSSDAMPVRLVARRERKDSSVMLELSSGGTKKADAVISRVAVKLAANCRSLGFFPVLPMLYRGLPGDGNHIGSVFPMKEQPKEFETDANGRLSGCSRVYIADASVLPELQAPTLTFTVMANAYRIGNGAAQKT